MEALTAVNDDRKYPHLRGENSATISHIDIWWEIPPLAWGKQWENGEPKELDGNTPTRVGKTLHEVLFYRKKLANASRSRLIYCARPEPDAV